MDWQKQVVRRTLEGAGEHSNVQLHLLLNRLEACPESLPHIADAIRDMGLWYQDQADALRDEVDLRKGGAA